jgi:high-affinity iron transporter
MLGTLVVVLTLTTSSADPSLAQWHRAVGLLEYLHGDYRAAVESDDAAELFEQRGLAKELEEALLQLGPPAERYVNRAQTLRAGIEQKAAPALIEAETKQLSLDIVSTQKLVRSPAAIPSLEKGKTVFLDQCAQCHGATGHADTQRALAMRPQPANFNDVQRMASVTAYKVLNTTRFGVPQTPMVPLTDLTDAQRWDVAFYVMSLRHTTPGSPNQPRCDDDQSNPASLEQLATLTDTELQSLYPTQSLACLRTTSPTINTKTLTSKAQRGIEQALLHFSAKDFKLARQQLVDVYLNDIEPLEPALKARNPVQLKQLEGAFAAAREAAEQGVGMEAPANELKRILASLAEKRQASDFWSVFVGALLILLREGFEATVVVGALLAVLKKMSATEHARVVHWGWISALVAGGLLFVFAGQFFAGANREWLESLVALAAVGMLIYAALWLNARANMSQFMTEMRGKMKAALTRKSALGLFLIAFSSVGRESVETVLFLQGLAADSRSGVLWGTLAGLGCLLGLVMLVRTVGFVLPMKTLFSASTALLLATAVVLLGKGLHGLQELDIVSFRPFGSFQVAALGVFPDLVTVASQGLLAMVLVAVVWWPKEKRSRVSTEATSSSA